MAIIAGGRKGSPEEGERERGRESPQTELCTVIPDNQQTPRGLRALLP